MNKRSKKVGLFCFTNDLRLHDNPALLQASQGVDELVCVYCIEKRWHKANRYGLSSLGEHRKRFLRESLHALRQELRKLNQGLIVIEGATEPSIQAVVAEFNVSLVYRSRNAGWYEQRAWAALQAQLPNIAFYEFDSHTLFDLDTLPCEIQNLPATFTKFRKLAEQKRTEQPIARLTSLPPPPSTLSKVSANDESLEQHPFNGGEQRALQHVEHYFSTELPQHYKTVRNAIDGWDNSCKLSPWLANGSLSAREVLYHLNNYEKNVAANDSTYWIYFELLWREYFQWYAHKIGTKLYKFAGIKGVSPLNSYYPERFRKWVAGNTPYPLVNACMKELAATGYLSNRGRQIVASCLVNELATDWRYGAAYFEHSLIDYDVASNWGNWQYLAGVGADARDKRHFNLDKQTQMFDANGVYREKWGANGATQPLDSVDAADWPI